VANYGQLEVCSLWWHIHSRPGSNRPHTANFESVPVLMRVYRHSKNLPMQESSSVLQTGHIKREEQRSVDHACCCSSLACYCCATSCLLEQLTKFGSSTIVQTFVNIERVDDLGFADGMLEGRLLELNQREDGQSVFGDLKFALRKCVAHFQISVS
jgi:hypothetical protein